MLLSGKELTNREMVSTGENTCLQRSAQVNKINMQMQQVTHIHTSRNLNAAACHSYQTKGQGARKPGS